MAEHREILPPSAPDPLPRPGAASGFPADVIAGYVNAPAGEETGEGVRLPVERDGKPEDATRREIVFIVGSGTEIVFGSGALLPALGFEPYELRGRPLVELMNAAEAADLVAHLETIDPRNELPTRLRMELRHKEGSACVLVGTVVAISEQGFGRSYVMRVRIAAFQGSVEDGVESGRGTFFRKARFDSL